MNFSAWHQHFLVNQQHFNHLDWQESHWLTPEETKRITSSIRQFQEGEHSTLRNKHIMPHETTTITFYEK